MHGIYIRHIVMNYGVKSGIYKVHSYKREYIIHLRKLSTPP